MATDPEQNQSSNPPEVERARPRRRRRFILVGLSICLVVIAALYVVARQRLAPSSGVAASVAPISPPVPVSVSDVARRDFPIYLRGIGSVQAYNTVIVKSRVDGELQQVLFREGQHVGAGDLLAQIDPRPFEAQLRQAEAVRDRDLALLETARLDLARSSELVGRGYTPRQTFETQKNQVTQLEAAVRADEASIETVKLQLVYARIASPLSGRTGVRLVDAGNMIRATDAAGIVSITQLQPISAMFTLPQDALPDVAAAMRAELPLAVTAYTQDAKRLLGTGTLELIDNAVDQATGTIRLKARFPNDDEALWPGQFVNIRLQLTVRRAAVVVAGAAVQRNQDGTYAWIVKSDGTAAVRPIRIEAIESGSALVVAGLDPGDVVVVDGHSRLRPGAKVVARAGPRIAATRAAEAAP
jgi:multidrug efflux system membrane fusion protein